VLVAKRLDCVRFSAAFELPGVGFKKKSGAEAHAVQTLRASLLQKIPARLL